MQVVSAPGYTHVPAATGAGFTGAGAAFTGAAASGSSFCTGLARLAAGLRSAVFTVGRGGGLAANASFFGAEDVAGGAGVGAASLTGAATGLGAGLGCAGGTLMAGLTAVG